MAMRFPYRFTGKGSAEQRVEKNHGLTKQHIQSFEASCYAFLYIVGIQSVRILKPDASFFPPSDQFDKTSLCKNLRAAVCPFAQGTPFDSRRIYNCGKTLARRQTAKRWAGFKGIRQGYREKLCPA